MNNSYGLATSYISFGGGNASLSWIPAFRNWSRPTDFAANGSLSPNVTAGPSGLTLAANWGNRLVNGNFSSADAWVYANGTGDNTTARWVKPDGVAELNHTSRQTAILWDPLTSIATNWTLSASFGSTSNLYQAHGAMGDFVNVSAGVAQYAGAQHIGSENWGSYDQLRMDIYQNASAPAAFNISAIDATFHTQTTAPIPLSVGWQTVTVDLDQLGSSRSSLSSLTLRIVGLGGKRLPPLDYNFAGIQLGLAKQADTVARVSQIFQKANTTTPVAGSAYLSFDWKIENSTGVARCYFAANMTGPAGGAANLLPCTNSGGWRHFSADVSASTAASGAYNLTFSLHVILDNITASNVTAFVDNAVFAYPDRGNGSYVSKPIGMMDDSQYLSLSWSGMLPSPETTIDLGFRTGNSTSSMGSWYESSDPGSYPLSDFGLFFQVRADLNTTNASLAPILSGFSLASVHRAKAGSIISGNYTAKPDFLGWRSLRADMNVPPSTSIAFWVGDGNARYQVPTDGNVSAFGIGRRIEWWASLQSPDGLNSPTVANVSLVYDFMGPPARVVVTQSGVPLPPGTIVNVTSGQTVSFGVFVYDSGSHPIPATAYVQGWTISNGTGGSVYGNGTYVAGKPGLWEIVVIVTAGGANPAIYASVWVNVTAATVPFSIWDAWPFMAVGIAALLGFAVYELIVRRLFAIDDVFLIGKDGRLMSHNTRRMLADRDEDILSGMLTAINSFVRDSWREENSHVRRFVIGGKTTVVERGEHVFLAAVYSGRVPGWASRDVRALVDDLEAYFGKEFASWSGSPEDLQSLREVMRRFASHVRYSRRRVWKGIAG